MLYLGRAPEALANFDQALALTPYYGPLWALKAFYAMRARRFDEAFVAYRTAVTLPSTRAESWAALAYVAESFGWPEEAIANANRALAGALSTGSQATAFAARAAALNDLHLPDEALVAADSAIALVGSRAFRAQIARAVALTQLGRSDEARIAAEHGLIAVEPLTKNDPDALGGKIGLLRLLGRDEEAVALATTAPEQAALPHDIAI